MCLRFDGIEYCHILRNAPTYQGLSLERVQHHLEENEFPYTEEIIGLLADTCGLPVEEYGRRLHAIRSTNALHQLGLLQGHNTLDRWRGGPYFDFPAVCLEYVKGIDHECPTVLHLSVEAQQAIREKMCEMRQKHFIRRLREGIPLALAKQYPEFEDWGALIEEDSGQHFYVGLRNQLRQKGALIAIGTSLYIPHWKFNLVIHHWARRRFFEMWHPKKIACLRTILDVDDMVAYEELLQEKARLENLPREDKHQKKLRRKALNTHKNALYRWRGQMRTKYVPLLEHQLAADSARRSDEATFANPPIAA